VNPPTRPSTSRHEFRATYPQLQFPYRFKANQRPFNVSAIYTDGRFTYIRIRRHGGPRPLRVDRRQLTKPVKTPNFVNFPVEHGGVHRPQGASTAGIS